MDRNVGYKLEGNKLSLSYSSGKRLDEEENSTEIYHESGVSLTIPFVIITQNLPKQQVI
jgi:hypothetical protein